jgi:hypothetical protein
LGKIHLHDENVFFRNRRNDKNGNENKAFANQNEFDLHRNMLMRPIRARETSDPPRTETMKKMEMSEKSISRCFHF